MSLDRVAEPYVDRPYIDDSYGVPASLQGTLPWVWARERLIEASIYWVATVWPNGRPHVTPTWGAWVDEAFWMEGGQRTRRFKNLRENPAAVVTIERGNDAIMLEGDAQLVPHLDEELTGRLLEGYAKYKQLYGYEAEPANWRMGIWRVLPSKVLGWSRFPDDSTRWTFERA